jgi:hypothetical protein
MLLATILLLWVAWARIRYYFPAFPGNFEVFGFVFAMAPIPLFIWLEWRARRRVHPVLLFGGMGLIAQQGLQVLFYGSDSWSYLARHAFEWMGGV